MHQVSIFTIERNPSSKSFIYPPRTDPFQALRRLYSLSVEVDGIDGRGFAVPPLSEDFDPHARCQETDVGVYECVDVPERRAEGRILCTPWVEWTRFS